MEKRNKGITLIALVITIIVLLILGAVSIATLTGENGILTQADKAKDKTAEADAIERVQVEVLGSYGTDGNIDIDQLNKNLKNIKGLSYNDSELSDSNKITNLPAFVTLNGYGIVIDGNVSIGDTLENAINNQTIYNENTKLVDEYGNIMVIPAGFKIASDSATDVTEGIVIEDSSYDGTIGSQFVWIPVGIVYTNTEKTESKTINLDRYTFASDGTPTAQGANMLLDGGSQELSESSYGNAVAKNLDEFITRVNNNHGYYLGRYEAGVVEYESVATSNSNSETNWTGYTGENIKLVCKLGQQVWNYVTQNKASELSRNMYTSSNFTSDLVNSYAWDTAIVFIQEFSEDTDYSTRVGATSRLSTTGMGVLSFTNEVDKECNIFDMASNCHEWTTETGYSSSNPCIHHGGGYNSGYSAGSRSQWGTSFTNDGWSFRPLLYL